MNAAALFQLGQVYASRRNYRKAFECFTGSFLAGYADAAGWIGECYRRDRGVKRDRRKAALWLKRSAGQGNERFLFELGCLLVARGEPARGRGYLRQHLEHHPDDDDAWYWIARSHEPYYAEAMPVYEELYARTRDPLSAVAMIRLKLRRRRCFAPDEFTAMTGMLRHAARHGVPQAGRFLRSKPRRRLAAGVMTSEAVAERYRRSLRRSDGSNRWVVEFQLRGGEGEFEIAKRYLSSSHWLDVITGAVLMAQLGAPFAGEGSRLLIAKMPEVETDDERRAILRSIGWQGTAAAGEFLLRFADSPDVELRHIAAWGLTGRNRAELDALLKLARDPEEYVWDWAVFNLIDEGGELYSELENGLTELAQRPDPLMRCQAIAALAARHAESAGALLRRELDGPVEPDAGAYLEDAARYLQGFVTDRGR